MIYKVILTYTDDRKIPVEIRAEELPKFIAAIKKGDFYQDEQTKVGFWTNGYVRYFVAAPQPDFSGKQEDTTEATVDMILEEQLPEEDKVTE